MTLKRHGINAVLSPSTENTDKNSIRADFDTDEYVGRITLWDSGECDMEIADIQSGEAVCWKHYTFGGMEEAEETMTEFVRRLHSSQLTKSA